MYEYLDQQLKKVVREIYRLFQKYRAMPFDELNVVSNVQELYRKLEEVNRQMFQQIADHYYDSEPHGDEVLVDWWLSNVLSTPSRVMKYSYDSEIVRKRDRLMEALLATNGSPAEFDTAMRYWTQMTGWFSVEVADAALAQAREDDGIEFVMWVSEHDLKTCDYCESLDCNVYHADAVPPKPHPNCRCYTVRI